MNGMSKMDLVLVLNSELTSNKTVCLIKGRPFLGGFYRLKKSGDSRFFVVLVSQNGGFGGFLF